MNNAISPGLSREAKAIVLLAFRNGPIENVHAGKICPTCNGNPEYTHITQEEMKQIMKNAVNQMATLMWLKENNPKEYERKMALAEPFTERWDDPSQPDDDHGFLAREDL
jgi:hypothetical protein